MNCSFRKRKGAIMPRIRSDLHNVLVAISNHGEYQSYKLAIHKLEMMGLIMYEFGGKWAITDEGKNYLLEVIPVELKPSIKPTLTL